MSSDYIECPLKNNLSKKHFQICIQCRKKEKCSAFQGWLDSELQTTTTGVLEVCGKETTGPVKGNRLSMGAWNI